MAFEKRSYEALPGNNGAERDMAKEGTTVVVHQPVKLTATEDYVLNLDPTVVSGKHSQRCQIFTLFLT